jgi:hypothetical protein
MVGGNFCQQSSAACLSNIVIPFRSRPPISLLKPLYSSLDVQPPLGEARFEKETLERQRYLDTPSVRVTRGCSFPDGIPIRVFAFTLVRNEGIITGAGGVDCEDISGSPVEVSIENELDVIFTRKRCITLAGEADDFCGLVVVDPDSKNNRVTG